MSTSQPVTTPSFLFPAECIQRRNPDFRTNMDPATWITDNFRCVHELQYHQIRCANSNAQLQEVSRLILADLQLSILFPRSPCVKGCHPQASLKICPPFLLHNYTLRDVWNYSCSIMMTDKHSLNHALHKWHQLLFSKLCKWVIPPATNSHFIQESHCDLRNPNA